LVNFPLLYKYRFNLKIKIHVLNLYSQTSTCCISNTLHPRQHSKIYIHPKYSCNLPSNVRFLYSYRCGVLQCVCRVATSPVFTRRLRFFQLWRSIRFTYAPHPLPILTIYNLRFFGKPKVATLCVCSVFEIEQVEVWEYKFKTCIFLRLTRYLYNRGKCTNLLNLYCKYWLTANMLNKTNYNIHFAKEKKNSQFLFDPIAAISKMACILLPPCGQNLNQRLAAVLFARF
jgi:hypothetical protein